jgi:hypothetical protein
MNIFCRRRTLSNPALSSMLGVPSGLVPQFGFRPQIPLRSGRTDRTEIDMKLGTLMVEAKLTETDFQTAPAFVHPKMTLAISPVVNSCSDPFLTAICWFLALSSRRNAPAQRIESSFIIICPCQASVATSPSMPCLLDSCSLCLASFQNPEF